VLCIKGVLVGVAFMRVEPLN